MPLMLAAVLDSIPWMLLEVDPQEAREAQHRQDCPANAQDVYNSHENLREF